MSPNLDYVARINRSIDYVVAHLHEPLPLEVVAKAAAFSPFHFHRVFKLVMDETLAHFVKRLRLERAVTLMSRADPPPLTRIALDCGFASSSDFSRSFKKHYGTSPSAFDVSAHRDRHRDRMLDQLTSPENRHRLERLPPSPSQPGFDVVIRELPPRTVAYRRVLQPYREGAVLRASEALVRWAKARGAEEAQWLGYQWDDPEVVALDKCRYDVAVVLDDVTPDDEVGRLRFPAMTVAEVALAGTVDLELRVLDWLFGVWLPRSSWVPDDQPCFEAWNGLPYTHGTSHVDLRIQLPVVATRDRY